MQVKDILYYREKGKGLLADYNYDKGMKRPNVDGYYECFIKVDDLKKLEDEIFQKGRDLSDTRQKVDGLNYELKQLRLSYQGLQNQYLELQNQNKNLQERGTKFSKANGKKEQKRSLQEPDYVIDKIEIDAKRQKFYYTYLTPYTLKGLQIKLSSLEKEIKSDLQKILKIDFKIIKIQTFDNDFYVRIETLKEIS